MAESSRRRRPRFSLYRCTTLDGDEDWFIVAATLKSASRFHEREEGYDPGEASAELVVALPAELTTSDGWRDPNGRAVERGPGWPSDALLIACGAEMAPLPPDPVRESLGVVCKDVRFGSRVFRAGDVVSDAQHEQGTKTARLSQFAGGRS